jgi:hypothetical protein
MTAATSAIMMSPRQNHEAKPSPGPPLGPSTFSSELI